LEKISDYHGGFSANADLANVLKQEISPQCETMNFYAKRIKSLRVAIYRIAIYRVATYRVDMVEKDATITVY
jgi:hypothetical protein